MTELIEFATSVLGCRVVCPRWKNLLGRWVVCIFEGTFEGTSEKNVEHATKFQKDSDANVATKSGRKITRSFRVFLLIGVCGG